ncbi:MAG: DUF4433 domain-containing protein [Saprospiraceae bacterium]|nr:DUF4433 domain-containing protein [Saprospiraceae bacterium]
MPKPDKIWLYRITHVDNLPHILHHGLVVAGHPQADPGFRSIGDSSLIGVRRELDAPDPPGGKFSEYVPFYLGHRSPMLYQIATGHEGVERIPQSDIVYIVAEHGCIVQNGLSWFFTDGHARHNMTQFYSDESGFDALDWEAIYAQQWNNTDEDTDRQRRKQAEYMVKGHVPASCFAYILVYDEPTQQKVLTWLRMHSVDIPVRISKQAYYDHL